MSARAKVAPCSLAAVKSVPLRTARVKSALRASERRRFALRIFVSRKLAPCRSASPKSTASKLANWATALLSMAPLSVARVRSARIKLIPCILHEAMSALRKELKTATVSTREAVYSLTRSRILPERSAPSSMAYSMFLPAHSLLRKPQFLKSELTSGGDRHARRTRMLSAVKPVVPVKSALLMPTASVKSAPLRFASLNEVPVTSARTKRAP
mmetsp:Transcript_3436/g.7734  ORF Transcript_3436/g.7734 Transcript_3436/m.7734 type:complete len:213 (+) Transcript_3436:638-1276(+)